jgi:hypothetical protein
MAIFEMPEHVSNMHTAGLVNRGVRFLREVVASASSSNGSSWLEPDRIRAATYFDELEAYLGYVEANNPLDLPKSHGVGYSLLQTVPTPEDIEGIENMLVQDLTRVYQAYLYDIALSQSADLSSGINKFDAERTRAIIKAGRDLINLGTIEIDLPENQGNMPVPQGASGASSSRRAGVRTLRG